VGPESPVSGLFGGHEVNSPKVITFENHEKIRLWERVENGLQEGVGGKTGIRTLRGVGRRSSSSPLQWRIRPNARINPLPERLV
jgi:hypothetical protein